MLKKPSQRRKRAKAKLTEKNATAGFLRSFRLLNAIQGIRATPVKANEAMVTTRMGVISKGRCRSTPSVSTMAELQ